MATVKVRIAVAVDPKGKWGSCGWDSDKKADQEEMIGMAQDAVEEDEAVYWLTAKR